MQKPYARQQHRAQMCNPRFERRRYGRLLLNSTASTVTTTCALCLRHADLTSCCSSCSSSIPTDRSPTPRNRKPYHLPSGGKAPRGGGAPRHHEGPHNVADDRRHDASSSETRSTAVYVCVARCGPACKWPQRSTRPTTRP